MYELLIIGYINVVVIVDSIYITIASSEQEVTNRSEAKTPGGRQTIPRLLQSLWAFRIDKSCLEKVFTILLRLQ